MDLSLLASRGIRSALWGMAVRVLALAATLLVSIALARVLGPKEFGIYSIALAIVTLIATPSQAGIPMLLVRETAAAEAVEDWARLRGLWNWATLRIVGMSIIVGLAAAAILLLVSEHWAPRRVLFWGVLLAPLIALGNARCAALRGLRKLAQGLIPETVIRPLLLVLGIAMASWIWGNVSASSAMAIHAAAAALSLLVGGWMLKSAQPKPLTGALPDLSLKREWAAAILPLSVVSGLRVSGMQLGILVVAAFASDVDAGIFKVAVSAATLALFGSKTALIIVAPYISKFFTRADAHGLQKVAALGSMASFAMTFPILVAFVFFGRMILNEAFGSDYSSAYVPMLVLCAGQVFASAFGSSAALLNMTSNERYAAKWMVITLIVNILLCVALVPAWGVIGAAVASAASTAMMSVACWRIAIRETGTDGSFLRALTYMRALFKRGS